MRLNDITVGMLVRYFRRDGMHEDWTVFCIVETEIGKLVQVWGPADAHDLAAGRLVKTRRFAPRDLTPVCVSCRHTLKKGDRVAYENNGGTGYPDICENCAEAETADQKIGSTSP